MTKSVAFCTLGCKVNQYETQALTELFIKKGYDVLSFDKFSDVYVINTCTVTNMSDRKSRQMIRRAKHLNPDAIIAVVGCYSQVSPDEVEKIEGVNIVLGTNKKEELISLVDDALKNKKIDKVGDILRYKTYDELEINEYSEKTRAFVKIEDGCNEFCTYCIIPFARGPVRSRKLENIIKEVQSLVRNGFSEIVLTGIHLASYGKDLENTGLYDVIEKVSKIDGIKRIRLGSLEPRILTEDFIKKISKIESMCNHFHISLQSGCDETLKRMRRKYTCDEYKESVKLLRKYFDNPAIATDIMVGFPGETEEEFKKSIDFMKEISFADAHVFSYSNRKGTKADSMENQVSPDVKEIRHKKMESVVNECRDNYLNKLIGKEVEVLFEQEVENGIWEGTTTNYVKVRVKSDKDISKIYKIIKITKLGDGFVLGEWIKKAVLWPYTALIFLKF